MAETSLDDFFAKKDKGKKKGKSKFTASDNADILDQPGIKPLRKEKKKRDQEKPVTNETTGTTSEVKEAEDSEWNNFKDEVEADYSGLRIQKFQGSNREEDDQTEHNENPEDEEDEEGKPIREAGSQGPWNKSQSSGPAPAIVEEEPKPVVKEEPAPAPIKSGKYVPPGMRKAMEGGGGGGGGGYSSRKKKVAPNLHSDFDFPSLGASGPGDGDVGGDRSNQVFEEVRGGGRQENPKCQDIRLELGNKFDALSKEDS